MVVFSKTIEVAVAAVKVTFIYYFDSTFSVKGELAFKLCLVLNLLCFKCFIRLFEESWYFGRLGGFDFLCSLYLFLKPIS